MRDVKELVCNNMETYSKMSPRFITLEITTACNKRCSYCYHSENNLKNKRHISNSLLKDVFTFIVNNGIQGVAITGGEPVLYPNFSYLIKELYKIVNSITVFTNGIGLHDGLYESIAEDRIYVNYSFDYDDIRNFEILENMMSFIPTNNLKVSLVYNGQEIEDFVECIRHIRKLFSGEIQINYAQFKGHAIYSDRVVSRMIELSKRLIKYNQTEALRIEGQYISAPVNSYFHQYKESSFNCSICNNLKIDIDGNIFPCPFFTELKYCIGSVKNYSEPQKLSDNIILKNMKKKLFSRIYSGKCSICKWNKLCGGGCLLCLETGDESGVNQISCLLNFAIYNYIDSIWKLR